MPIIEGATGRGPRNETNTDTVASIVWMTSATAPTNGTTGAGFAAKGSHCSALDTGKLYINNNTAASPTWGIVTSA